MCCFSWDTSWPLNNNPGLYYHPGLHNNPGPPNNNPEYPTMQGAKSFFVMPFETLQNGIEDVYILGEEDGLILKAEEEFKLGVIIHYTIYTLNLD